MRTARWLVPALLIVVWLAVGSFGGQYAGKLSSISENNSSYFLPESAESTRVTELERQFADTEAIPAIVVAERGSGITGEDQRYLAEKGAEIAGWDGTMQGPPPIPSEDGRALELIVPITAKPGDVVEPMRELFASPPDGLSVYVTGPAGQVADIAEAFGGIDGLLLLVAAAVVALILVVVYRSPLLPLVVLISSVFALSLASVLVYVLADADVISLNSQSQGILFILVFGAATDYALLLVARYREELRTTGDKVAAMRTAWRATIEPVVASAGTVILGLLCLLFSDLESNKGLGPVATIGIVSSVLASMTFLPAVLALIGRAAYWPFRPMEGSAPPESGGLWGRIAKRVDKRPRAVWLVTSLVLLVGAAFVPQLKASGTAESDIFLNEVESVAGQEVLSRHFPGGSGSPAVVIADASRADEVLAATEGVRGVAEAEITGTADGLVRISATLSDAADSDEAIATVERLRESVHAVDGADALVGGSTAEQLDTRTTSERDRTVIIPIVLVVVFAVLALLLRALVAPLLLIATVVLSFAATMGVSALVFNHVFDFPGADPAVPLFAFVFLVALGIDYNIFLMTRVREETLSVGTHEGTLRGLTVTGGVITSAGVVLAATFSALAVLPILFLAQLAFIVAFGVLLDTLIVRSLLVPALTIDIGRKVWWPSKLAKAEPTPPEGEKEDSRSGE